MRGRKPRSLRIVPHDAPILQEIARSRSLPWYQIQRARIVLGVAAGESIQLLAVQTQHDPSTIWRVCRRYEDSGLSGLLAPPQRSGRPARISPPPEGPDRPVGLPGADRQGIAHPDYQQWKDGETESDWRDLISASIEEHLIAVRHSPDAPVSREARKEEEHAILREIVQNHPSRDERVRVWIERTGKSERAFYRRLADLR